MALTFEEAFAAAQAKRDQARELALKFGEQKQTGAVDPALKQQLDEACKGWDEWTAAAVEAATDLNSFRAARSFAPEDGLAHNTVPKYLTA